ncbi:polysaccharide deacetylase family protein [Sorangium sp. So ce117]|uniref:polysaccharide deacetylase family protein n=1 Tax=Sorangium sp. So ce117 TaxID=3133277 RepID=UPI003F629C08
MLLLGTLHVSGCGDDGEDTTSGGTTGGQQTTSSSSSGGTPGSSSSSGGDPGATSASAGGGDGGSNPAGTGGADPAGGGGSDPAGGTGGTGGAGTGGSGDGGEAPESGLPPGPGAGNVPKPGGAAGGFKVIDWAGFAGAVTYSFDDSNQTQIQNYDAMNALGVPFTFYVWTGKSEANNAVWQKAQMDGHEIGNHTSSHAMDDPGGSATDSAQQWIKQKFGITAYTMAAPYGANGYTSIAQSRFLINRGVSNALIGPNDNSNAFQLPTYIPPTNASKAQMDSEVASARSGKKWRTFCIHGFTGGNDSAYQPIPFQAWVDHVKAVKAYGDVWIGTMETIGAYWRGQKAITDGTNTKNGNDTTYNWTLPQNFPPGKYVRVTVTGGTLKQNGTALKWHPQGYYEVALDAKSVTLSP